MKIIANHLVGRSALKFFFVSGYHLFNRFDGGAQIPRQVIRMSQFVQQRALNANGGVGSELRIFMLIVCLPRRNQPKQTDGIHIFAVDGWREGGRHFADNAL